MEERAATAGLLAILLAAGMLLPAVATAAEPESLWVAPAEGLVCPSPVQLSHAFAERFPEARVRLGEPSAEGLVARVAAVRGSVELRLERGQAVLVSRRFAIGSDECEELARTLALVVEARLAQGAWSVPATPDRPGASALPVMPAETERPSEPAAIGKASAKTAKLGRGAAEVHPARTVSALPVETSTPENEVAAAAAPASADGTALAAQTGPGAGATEAGAREEGVPAGPASEEKLASDRPAAEEAAAPASGSASEPAVAAPPSSEPSQETEASRRVVAALLGGGSIDATGAAGAWEGTLRAGVVVGRRFEILVGVLVGSPIRQSAGNGTLRASEQELGIVGRAALLRTRLVELKVALGAGAARIAAESEGFLTDGRETDYAAVFSLGPELDWRVWERVSLTASVQASLRTVGDEIVVEGVDETLLLRPFRLRFLAGVSVALW